MNRSTHSYLLLTALTLGVSSQVFAQGIPTIDSTHLQPVTSAGSYLMHWTAEDGTNGEQTIYLKNVSKDRALTITSWEVYDCYNVAGRICRRHDAGPTIKPGKTVRLETIRASRAEAGYQYRYRFTQQWTDELPGKTQ